MVIFCKRRASVFPKVKPNQCCLLNCYYAKEKITDYGDFTLFPSFSTLMSLDDLSSSNAFPFKIELFSLLLACVFQDHYYFFSTISNGNPALKSICVRNAESLFDIGFP